MIKLERLRQRLGPAACATSRGDRLFFAAMALIVGTMATSMLTGGNLLCGVPAALCTTFLVIGAVTGWCPTQLFASRTPQKVGASDLPVPEVSGVIDLDRRA